MLSVYHVGKLIAIALCCGLDVIHWRTRCQAFAAPGQSPRAA